MNRNRIFLWFQFALGFIIFAIAASFLSCRLNADKPITFVQLCDTQLGMGGYKHDVAAFKQAVKQINKLSPDFVIICGDLVDEASRESYTDFKDVKNNLNMPCYLAPGNHDVGNIPDKSSLEYYRRIIGRDYHIFKYKNSSFLVVNTQLWKADVQTESKKHDKWFVRSLDSLGETKQNIIVVGHYPLFINTVDERESYFNIPFSKREEILFYLEKNKVKAYLSGHTHELVINNYQDILFVSGETTSKNFDNRPLGFRLWNIYKDSLSQKFYSLNGL